MAYATFGSSIDIAATPERVWNAVTDWDSQGEWIPLTRTHAVGEPTAGLGGRVRAWTGVGPIGFWDSMTITDWDPPRRCEVLHTGTVVRGEAAFEVEGTPQGARFTWWERVVLPGGRLGGLAWPLARPGAVALLDVALRRLRRLVEQEPVPGQGH
jgi:hypothetical protein